MRATVYRLCVCAMGMLLLSGASVLADSNEMHESAEIIAQRTAVHKLHAAVRSGDPKAIDAALEAGLDINDSAALELAILAERPDIVDHLISRGADVNKPGLNGELPIVAAMRQNRPELMQHLVDKGADVNRPDRRGITALDHAQHLGRPDTVEILQRKGARARSGAR